MVGFVHKDTETGCLIPVTTAGPVGGTVEKLEYGCNRNYALPLTENTAGEGYVGISCEYPIYYNPASGLLTVESICGNITNADIAECVAVNNTNSNVSFNIPLICDCKIYRSANTNLTYNPATSQLTVTNGSICVDGGPNCSIINQDCIITTCLFNIETNTGNVNASSVTTMCLDANCICTGYCGMLTGYLNGTQPGWGNQTGTAVAGWNDCTGGEVYFRRDNPTYGQLSMILDGTVYVDEGRYAVVHDGNIWSKTVGTALQTCNVIAAGNAGDLVYSQMAGSDFFRIRVGGANEQGWAEIATADDGSEPIYVRQYTGVFQNVARTACLLDGSGNTKFPGVVQAENGFIAWKGDVAANSNVAGFCMHSTTSGQGYNGGAYVGHCNANYSGWWGYATFGFYNAENDTLCRGICVGNDGALFGVSANCLGFNGACYIPTADNIRYYLLCNMGVTGSVSGCTLYLRTSSWS